MQFVAPLAAIFCLCLIILFAARIGRSPVTIAVLSIATGYGLHLSGGLPFEVMHSSLELLAEATLAILLFADAAHMKLARLRTEAVLPFRLLVLGLPLSVLIGTAVFLPLFGDLGIWEIILLAALLAPTDAALGTAIFENPAVPEKLRNTLLAESGLNDGLALPFIIFAACAAVGFEHELQQESWLVFAAQQVGLGLVAGVVFGAAASLALRGAIRSGFAKQEHGAIFALLVILLIYFATAAAGGNAFVSIFVAGLVFGQMAEECATAPREFLDTDGLLLTMTTFVFIGLSLLPAAIEYIDWRGLAAIFLALFLVRPLAVWLALAGSKMDLKSRLFVGWFGPRGVATALFALFVLSEFDKLRFSETMLSICTIAVVASAVLHGASAYFGGRLFRKPLPDLAA